LPHRQVLPMIRGRGLRWYDGLVQRSIAWGLRIVGVLLVLLGIVLLLAPAVSWQGRETVVSTPSVELKSKRERVVVVPRAVAALILAAGVVVLLAARKHAE